MGRLGFFGAGLDFCFGFLFGLRCVALRLAPACFTTVRSSRLPPRFPSAPTLLLPSLHDLLLLKDPGYEQSARAHLENTIQERRREDLFLNTSDTQ